MKIKLSTVTRKAFLILSFPDKSLPFFLIKKIIIEKINQWNKSKKVDVFGILDNISDQEIKNQMRNNLLP